MDGWMGGGRSSTINTSQITQEMEEGWVMQVGSNNCIIADIKWDIMESEGDYVHVHSVKLRLCVCVCVGFQEVK